MSGLASALRVAATLFVVAAALAGCGDDNVLTTCPGDLVESNGRLVTGPPVYYDFEALSEAVADALAERPEDRDLVGFREVTTCTQAEQATLYLEWVADQP